MLRRGLFFLQAASPLLGLARVPGLELKPSILPVKTIADESALRSASDPTEFNDMIYNPFSRRMVKKTSGFMRDLCSAGFKIDEANGFRVCLPSEASGGTPGGTPGDGTVNWTALLEKGNSGWRRTLQDVVKEQPENPRAAVEKFLDKAYERNVVMPPKLALKPDPTVAGVELTPDQENVMRLVRQGYCVYIGGNAGTGKTLLMRAIAQLLTHEIKVKVAICATTGVAGVHLGGCTFHHALGVPFKNDRKWDHAALRAIDALIIDEASLLDDTLLETFDYEARVARLDSRPFGGLQVILCGDFLQLAAGSSSSKPCFHSPLFAHLIQLALTTTLRHKADEPLFPMLNRLRVGEWDPLLAQLDKPESELPHPDTVFVFPRRKHAETMNQLQIQQLPGEEKLYTPQRGPLTLCGAYTTSLFATFPSTISRAEFVEKLATALSSATVPVSPSSIVMMPCRGSVVAFCVRCRLNHPGEIANAFWQKVAAELCATMGVAVHEFLDKEPVTLIPDEISIRLAGCDTAHMSLTPLTLKRGCKVMVLKNFTRTIINGGIGKVVDFIPPTPAMWPGITGGAFGCNLCTPTSQLPDKSLFAKQLPVIELTSGEVFQCPVVSEIVGGGQEVYGYGHEMYSLPLQLGYAFTVHKVQGLTLDCPVLFDCREAFHCEHMVYVACSRVRSLAQLTVRGINAKHIVVNRAAKEFALKLQDAAKGIAIPQEAAKGSWADARRCQAPLAPTAANSSIA